MKNQQWRSRSIRFMRSKNHPFKVHDDEKMQDLIESVKKKLSGVLTPVLLQWTVMMNMK